MRDLPVGDGLLATAQKVLRERILPSLPADKKHDALMILNAMSIASRQIEQGEEPERHELQALYVLLGTGTDKAADEQGLRSALLEVNRTLSRHIRSGACEPGQRQRAALFDHLRTVARQRVLESNPKYLKA